jgi:replicative DNA helicase
MKTTTHGLTPRQLERVENFLSQFTDIEKALKRKLRLHADDHTPVSAMAKRYAEMNPYWRKSEMLLRLAEIRNVLTHVQKPKPCGTEGKRAA